MDFNLYDCETRNSVLISLWNYFNGRDESGYGGRWHEPGIVIQSQFYFLPMMISFVRVVLMQSLWSVSLPPLNNWCCHLCHLRLLFFQLLCIVVLCNVTQWKQIIPVLFCLEKNLQTVTWCQHTDSRAGELTQYSFHKTCHFVFFIIPLPFKILCLVWLVIYFRGIF